MQLVRPRHHPPSFSPWCAKGRRKKEQAHVSSYRNQNQKCAVSVTSHAASSPRETFSQRLLYVWTNSWSYFQSPSGSSICSRTERGAQSSHGVHLATDRLVMTTSWLDTSIVEPGGALVLTDSNQNHPIEVKLTRGPLLLHPQPLDNQCMYALWLVEAPHHLFIICLFLLWTTYHGETGVIVCGWWDEEIQL